jgi:hypothetical protein
MKPVEPIPDRASRGGRLVVDLDPEEIWDQLDAKVEPQISDGGRVWNPKPFRGMVGRDRFCYRHEVSWGPFLEGRFAQEGNVSVIEFRIQPRGPIPILTTYPVVVFVALVVMEIILVPIVYPESALVVWIMMAVIVTLAFVLSFVLNVWKWRHDAGQLLKELRRLFADVVIEQALPGQPRNADEGRP